MRDSVTRGESISSALEGDVPISPSIVQAVRTGEQSGRLGEAVTYIADVLDEENSEILNATTKLIEPLVLIIMGIIVGTVAISLFMPLFDMTAAV
jgi:type IV pilus assembly protein PilC